MFKERRALPTLLRLMYIAETLINPLFTNVAFHRDSEGDRSGHYESSGAFPLHGTVRFGTARYGTVRLSLGRLHFHRSLVPL